MMGRSWMLSLPYRPMGSYNGLQGPGVTRPINAVVSWGGWIFLLGLCIGRRRASLTRAEGGARPTSAVEPAMYVHILQVIDIEDVEDT